MFAFLHSQHGHAHGLAAGDANLAGWQADQAAAIGHQHHVVGLAHGEAGDDGAAGPGGKANIADALAAAPGNPVFVGRAALAEARIGYGEQEALGRLQLSDAFGGERCIRLSRLVLDGGEFGGRLFQDFRGFARAPLGAGLAQVGGTLAHTGVDMVEHHQRDHPVIAQQTNAAHPGGVAPGEDAQRFRLGHEPDALACPRRQEDVIALAAGRDPDQLVALIELHRDEAHGADVAEIRQLVAPHPSLHRGEHEVKVFPERFVLRQRQHGGDALALMQLQKLTQRAALAVRTAFRQLPDLAAEGHAAAGEEQHPLVGVSDEAAHHHIALTRRGGAAAAATAILCPEGVERRALHIAVARDGDDHGAGLDQAFVVQIGRGVVDTRQSRRRDLRAHRQQLVANNLHAARAAAQNVQQVADLVADFAQLGGDLVAFQPGQALQPQLQNAAGLLLGQPHRAGVGDYVALVLNQVEQHAHVARGPVAAHQGFARGCRFGAGADDADDLVDIGDRDGQADQLVAALARLAQTETAAAGDDVLTEAQERLERGDEPHLLGRAVIQRKEVDGKADLQLRHPVELVQHHLGRRVALQLDDQAHAVTVALVAQVGNAFDCLGADQLGDLLLQRDLIHLVGHFGDDDRFATGLLHRLDLAFRTQRDGAPARLESAANARAAQDDAAGWEVRSGHDLHQIIEGAVRFLDQPQRGVDHLARVVRRDVGGHAHGDAVGAVDQQVGVGGRQHAGLGAAVVVGGGEVDGILIDALEQRHRRAGQPRLGVAHRRRRIAVHAAEIALAVDQGHAHGEGLRHADHGVVNRGVAMRVVFAHHVARDAGRFAVRLVGGEARFVHRVENAAMNRLEAVTNIGKCPGDDNAHGVIEEGFAHFLLDGDGGDVVAGDVWRVAHGRWFRRGVAVSLGMPEYREKH